LGTTCVNMKNPTTDYTSTEVIKRLDHNNSAKDDPSRSERGITDKSSFF